MNVDYEKTRIGFGHGLVEAGRQNENVVVLVGDLTGSTNVNFFKEEFPDRFIQMGIAEQNMMNVAAGLSVTGKIPYLSTYGAFAALRSADQMRVTIAYSDLNVNIGGAHGGISVGPDGASHQVMEEIAIVRSIPNMQICVPADYHETYKATVAAAKIPHPCYIRFGRESVPTITDAETPFEWGKGYQMRDGGDVAIIACGVMVYEALCAAETLEKSGIDARVINIHTVKPIDREIIIKAACECGAIVTAEEHQINGGFSGAVAEVVVQNHPVPMEFNAVNDRFGVSGKQDELMDAFGLKSRHIVEKVERVLKRK